MKKIYLYFLTALLVAFYSNMGAQELIPLKTKKDSTFNYTDTLSLGEITVSGFKVDRKLRDLPASISLTKTIDYQKVSAFSLSHVLNSQPGISMGGDGVWSTNVNIRGLGESRFVTLIDGNRVETATDLTASLSMIDVNEIERVEVIKGAQSSLYGTGAMGGIVNIITKDGRFANKTYLSGNIISGYATVNSLFSTNGAIGAGSRNWYVRASGSYYNADDLRTPNGILPNSQFRMNNVSVKAGVKPFTNHIIKVQYQRNGSLDVGIPGGESFPGPAEATYKDISRELWSASYEISNITDIFSSLQISYFDQFINRDVSVKPNTVTEVTMPNGFKQITTPTLMTPGGKHHTKGFRLQGKWDLSEKNTLISGIDIWGRKLSTTREKYINVNVINTSGDTVTKKSLVRGETPIPESKINSAGIFLQNETKLADGRLVLITGGRIDNVNIKNEAGYDVDYIEDNGVRNDNPPTQRKTFDKGSFKSLSWSANVGLLYKVNKITDLTFNIARSFRAPSLEERFKYIDLGNLVRLGNIGLNPEKGYSSDLGIRIWGSNLIFSSSLFINRITDMIAETPGEFIYTLTATSEPETLPALINSNISKALLYGFDFKADYSLSGNWLLFISGSYVRGKADKAKENLPMIPPLNGRAGINYSNNKIGSAELSLTAAAKQNKVAPGEKETSGFYRVDLAFNTKRIILGKSALQIFFGVDNLTDVAYTNHLSTNRGGINIEPGRNLFARFNFSF